MRPLLHGYNVLIVLFALDFALSLLPAKYPRSRSTRYLIDYKRAKIESQSDAEHRTRCASLQEADK